MCSMMQTIGLRVQVSQLARAYFSAFIILPLISCIGCRCDDVWHPSAKCSIPKLSVCYKDSSNWSSPALG